MEPVQSLPHPALPSAPDLPFGRSHGSVPDDVFVSVSRPQEGCSVPTDAIGIPWSGRIPLVVGKILCQVRALDAARDLVTSNPLDVKVIGLAWSPRERVDRADYLSAKTCPGERLQ